MWSLGMVALALLSTITNAELQELTQMDQASLAECVDTIISKRKVPPSENGLLFVRSCLQVSPIKRLKADNAMRHVWLCTPKKHVDFFRRLDNKMMESFQVQDEIRAIPWELPDVEGVGAHQPAAVDQVPNLGCGRENAFLGINSTERIPEPNGDGRPREQTTSGLSHDDGPLVSFVGTGGTMAENSVGEDSFTKATTETVVGRGKRQERGCSLSTSGAKFLSLTDLNRHLKKPRQLNHQMHIPEELKVTKSKFLDIAPEGIATNTLSVGISQKSKSSAKRQKT